MQYKNTLALCAALLTAVAEGRIAFTTLPSSVTAGSPVKLAWEGSDGTPITITLKQGESNNLKTVSLITGSASGNSYTWTPSSDLPNGSNYALQIAQDDSDINYTGLFSITGGSSSSSASSSASLSFSASASGSPTASSNVTVTATSAPSGTAPGSAGITGTSASRNTTLSRATLSSSRTASSSESTSEATTTSGEGSSETSATSSPSPTGAAVTIASNFGLLLAGFAAVIYLG